MEIPENVKITPMLRQYIYWKDRYSDCLLFFRMGDFYELFFDDAETASRILDITLTARDQARSIPMAGVPFHSADSYIERLVNNGYRVAICEQVSDPRSGDLVEREVVRVATPGTWLSPGVEAGGRLAAVCGGPEIFACAFLDTIEGVIYLSDSSPEQAVEELQSFSPSEIIIPDNASDRLSSLVEEAGSRCPGTLPPVEFSRERGLSILKRRWNLETLEGFGVSDLSLSLGSAGALCRYLEETQFSSDRYLDGLRPFERPGLLRMDAATQKNLELVCKQGPDLFGVMNHCVTAMGKRLLREWILEPLFDEEAIVQRQDAVESFLQRPSFLDSVRKALSGCGDAGKAVARLGLGYRSPKDIGVIRDVLNILPRLAEYSADSSLPDNWKTFPDVGALGRMLSAAITESPPRAMRDGNIIRSGYDPCVDELRDFRDGARDSVELLQERERRLTGVKNLKVGYNRVFGYYIEMGKAAASRAPEHYVRKQTLVNAERFITEELKEFEEKVLAAAERLQEREETLFSDILDKVMEELPALREIAVRLGEIDLLASLAILASMRGYVRPVITHGEAIRIEKGRHPVIEASMSGKPFTPNSLHIDSCGDRVGIVTGPNMAGKSTYLRMAALIVVMAQCGSWVPAQSAEIGLVDRIFCRIGARDELSRGRSTFMMEMVETAAILRNVSPLSLVVLDEIGRGTSTWDGMSIAWAVIEYLHSAAEGRAKVLFATHYHELTVLADMLPGVCNLSMAVEENEQGVLFLYRVDRVPADRSYGIEVARIAGIPEAVIHRSRQLLKRFESRNDSRLPGDEPEASRASEQLKLFSPEGKDILEELAKLEPDRMTPLESLEILYSLRKRARKALDA